jgi:hypothetical protein
MVRREGLGSQRVLSGVLAEMHNLVYARFRCIHIGPKKKPSDQEMQKSNVSWRQASLTWLFVKRHLRDNGGSQASMRKARSWIVKR